MMMTGSERNSRSGLSRSDKTYILSLVLVVGCAAGLSLLFFSTFTISGIQGRSMEPTFSEGEYLLA